MFEFFKNLSINKIPKISPKQTPVVSIGDFIAEQTVQYIRFTCAALHREKRNINTSDDILIMHIMTLFIAHQIFYLELQKRPKNNMSEEKCDAYISEILKMFMEELILMNHPKEECLAELESMYQLNEKWEKICSPSNDFGYKFDRRFVTNALVWETLELIGFDIDPLEGTMPSDELFEKHGLLPTLSSPISLVEMQEIGMKSAHDFSNYLKTLG